MKHLHELNPAKDLIPISAFTKDWFKLDPSTWPLKACVRLWRWMHERDIYSYQDVKTNPKEIEEIAHSLRRGTELEEKSSKSAWELFKRWVVHYIEQSAKGKLLDEGILVRDDCGDLVKSERFRRCWEERETYWKKPIRGPIRRHSSSTEMNNGQSDGTNGSAQEAEINSGRSQSGSDAFQLPKTRALV